MAACEGLYFGNAEHSAWLVAPDADMDMSPAGWGESGMYVNGGAFVRRSVNTTQVYRANWSMKTDEQLSAILDFYHGRYGDGPFYMLMPGSYDNVLPRAWSMPRIALKDGPTLAKGEARPSAISVAGVNGRPKVAARYLFTDPLSPRRTATVNLPPGYYLHVGVHGLFDEGVRLHVGEQAITPMAQDSDQLVNATITTPGLHVFSVRGVGEAVIGAITARVTRTPQQPTGQFIPGKGTSGVEFEPGSVNKTMYSAVKNYYHGSATFLEVEQWL